MQMTLMDWGIVKPELIIINPHMFLWRNKKKINNGNFQ